jgi:hypothetical protein
MKNAHSRLAANLAGGKSQWNHAQRAGQILWTMKLVTWT